VPPAKRCERRPARGSCDGASLSGSSGCDPLGLRHYFRAGTDDPIDGADGSDRSDAFRRCRRQRTRRHSTQFGKLDPRSWQRAGQHHNMSCHRYGGKLNNGYQRRRLAGVDERYVGDRSIRDSSTGGHLQPIDADNCTRIQQRCTAIQSRDDHCIGVWRRRASARCDGSGRTGRETHDCRTGSRHFRHVMQRRLDNATNSEPAFPLRQRRCDWDFVTIRLLDTLSRVRVHPSFCRATLSAENFSGGADAPRQLFNKNPVAMSTPPVFATYRARKKRNQLRAEDRPHLPMSKGARHPRRGRLSFTLRNFNTMASLAGMNFPYAALSWKTVHRFVLHASRRFSGIYSAGKTTTVIVPCGPKCCLIVPPRLLASDAMIFVPFPGRMVRLHLPLSAT
jgi:hypothetical protein